MTPASTQPSHYLTLTAIAFRSGEHSRHKELVRALLAAGREVIWIGPSREDVADLPGLTFLPLRGSHLLKVPFLGRVTTFLISLWAHRATVGRAQIVVVLRDPELLAVRLFPSLRDRPVCLVLRNDLVRKARVRAAQASCPAKRLIDRMRAAFYLALQHRLYPRVTRLIVQTPAIACELEGRLGEHIPEPVVVPNNCRPSWVRGPSIDLRREWQDRPDQVLIGYVGNLLWEIKGLDILFDAFAEIRRQLDAKLVIIGTGPAAGRVERRALRDPSAGAIDLLGQVPDAARLMRNFDLLLVPSRYDDCPNVVLEALAARVPLVASSIEAHAFLLSQEAALVPCGDASAMACRALEILLDQDARKWLLAVQEARRQLFDFDWGREMVRRLG